MNGMENLTRYSLEMHFTNNIHMMSITTSSLGSTISFCMNNAKTNNTEIKKLIMEERPLYE